MGKLDKLYGKLLSDNSKEIVEALRELANVRDKDGIHNILPLCNSDDFNVKLEAVICIGKLGSEKGGDTLVNLMENSESEPALLIEVAIAIGKLGARGYRPAKEILEKYIEHPNFRVRKYVIKSLGMCGDKNTIDKLEEIFNRNDTSLEIKQTITTAIGMIGGSHAMHVLSNWVKEGTMEVRRDALSALGTIANESAVDILIDIVKDKKESKVIRNYAITALKNIEMVARDNYLTLKKKISKYT